MQPLPYQPICKSFVVQFSAAQNLLFLAHSLWSLSFGMILQVWQNPVCPSLDAVYQSVSSSKPSFCRAMGALKAELDGIDGRLEQYAQQL